MNILARALFALFLLPPCGFIVAMDKDNASDSEGHLIEDAMAKLEEGVSSRGDDQLEEEHTRLAIQAKQKGMYRAKKKKRKSPAHATKSTKKEKEKQLNDDHIEGLDVELEELVPPGVNPDHVAICDKLSEYNGTFIEGVGNFNIGDAKGRAQIMLMLTMMEADQPKEYESFKNGLVARGPGSQALNNEALRIIAQGMKELSGEIRFLNDETTRVGEAGLKISLKSLETAQEALEEEKRAHAHTRYRYRCGTVWLVVGGTVTLITTNLINYFLNQISDEELNQMFDMMQNVTMS